VSSGSRNATIQSTRLGGTLCATVCRRLARYFSIFQGGLILKGHPCRWRLCQRKMLILPSFTMALCSHLVIFPLRYTRQRLRSGANPAAFCRLWFPLRLPTFGNSQRHLFINSRIDWKDLKIHGRPLQMILRVRIIDALRFVFCSTCYFLVGARA
jgi:hypothetical protein